MRVDTSLRRRRPPLKRWVPPASPFAGLPSRGSRVRVLVDGAVHGGLVHGYSLMLGSGGVLLWLDERPGVLTRLAVETIEDWGHHD